MSILQMLGIVGPVVAIATCIAIYVSHRYLQRPHEADRNEPERRRPFDNNYNGRHGNRADRPPPTRVGDICAKCLEVIQAENIHTMQCGHALHKECFNEIRLIRAHCVICHAKVIYTQPGDRCVICFEDMETSDMEYLRCGHAFHNACINDRRNNRRFCPHCLASF